MDTEHTEATGHHGTNGAGRRSEFVRHAREVAGKLPTQIDERIRQTPYAMIGGAFVVGASLGVILSSRVLRAVIAAAATTAATELAKRFVRDQLTQLRTN